jgi:hypothetical protein
MSTRALSDLLQLCRLNHGFWRKHPGLAFQFLIWKEFVLFWPFAFVNIFFYKTVHFWSDFHILLPFNIGWNLGMSASSVVFFWTKLCRSWRSLLFFLAFERSSKRLLLIMKFFHFVKFDLLLITIDSIILNSSIVFVVISQLFVNEFYMKSYFLDWDLLQRMMLFFHGNYTFCLLQKFQPLLFLNN